MDTQSAIEKQPTISRSRDSTAHYAPTPQAQPDVQMTGADLLIDFLVSKNIEDIFGYPGGAILPVYDALSRRAEDIRHLTTFAESGAAHAAEGYSRVKGKPGVVITTSGPGALNTVTAIKDAQADSVPILVITGQVHSHRIGTEAFQEADIVATMGTNAKAVFQITKIEDIPDIMDTAFRTMTTGRPGPVIIDFPKDIQEQSCITRTIPTATVSDITAEIIAPQTDYNLEQTAIALMDAQRPVMIFGNGVRISGNSTIELAREIIDETGIPVVETLLGRGTIQTTKPENLGMGGMHGLYEANMAMQNADVILNVGGRFDDRFVGNPNEFAPHAKIIHIDIDPKTLSNSFYHAETGIQADAFKGLTRLTDHWRTHGRGILKTQDLSTWHDQISQWKEIDCRGVQQNDESIHPAWLMAQLNRQISVLPDYTISTEVGQHQMWAAQHFDFTHPRQFLTSGGLGTMGYGKPAAIGALIADPHIPTFVISGDASFYMNMQELPWSIQNDLPLKIVVLKSKGMGMVQQWQDRFYEGRRSNSNLNTPTGTYANMFKGMGGEAMSITSPQDLNSSIEKMISASGAFLLEVSVDDTHCTPMVPGGKANDQMVLSDEAEARVHKRIQMELT